MTSSCFAKTIFVFRKNPLCGSSLLDSDKPLVRDMTDRLFSAAAGSMDDVPVFDELVERFQIPTYTASHNLTLPQLSTGQGQQGGLWPAFT